MTKRLCWVLTLVLGCAGYGHALTLSGQITPSPESVEENPCADHPGYSCTATAYDLQVLSAGRNDVLESAWNTKVPGWDPAGWTLQWSTQPLDAVLNVTAYRAYNYSPENPSSDPAFTTGAEIRIDWTPTADQKDLRWMQAIHTNRPSGTTSQNYLDVFYLRPPWDLGPVYPYSYSDYHFYDKPSRPDEAGQQVFWDGYLYLARVDRTNKVATVYEGVYWGYSVDSVPVPEPSGVMALVFGAGWILTLKGTLRRRS